jgi:hypothetical protein
MPTDVFVILVIYSSSTRKIHFVRMPNKEKAATPVQVAKKPKTKAPSGAVAPGTVPKKKAATEAKKAGGAKGVSGREILAFAKSTIESAIKASIEADKKATKKKPATKPKDPAKKKKKVVARAKAE